jgi:glutamyl-tRNA synthetase
MPTETKTVRTRFAPSPTGYLHIGGARTAFYSWLATRHWGGQFILRIEDTDRERSTQAAIDAILQSMNWLGLDFDEGPYYQTQRLARYQEVIQQLLDEDKAYYCYCTREELDSLRAEQLRLKQKPRYDGRYRNYQGPVRAGVEPVVRFKNPQEGVVVVNDLVRGQVVFNNAELDDLVVLRTDGLPTYNFAVVVDDMDMGISHVLRGDDHLNNTPRQINMLRALGVEPPYYAHIPMILGADGKKLSKRHGAVSVMRYREEGYLPDALLNYLVRLGWSHGDQEIFTRDELIRLFEIKDINQSAAIFNPEKLVWVNQRYLQASHYAQCAEELAWHLEQQQLATAAGPDLELLFEVQKERTKTLRDMVSDSRIFYQTYEHYDRKAAAKHLKPESAKVLENLYSAFKEISAWKRTQLHGVVEQVAKAHQLKMGKVAQPLRVALTGSAASPSIDATLELLGKPQTLSRIKRTLDAMNEGTLV